MPSTPETRIQELHLTLPAPAKPVAKYKTAVLVGNILYVSGHGDTKNLAEGKGRRRADAGSNKARRPPAMSASTSWPRCATPWAHSTR